MIIITGTVIVRIYQCCSVSVFKFLFYKIDIYRKTHDQKDEDALIEELRGTGIE